MIDWHRVELPCLKDKDPVALSARVNEWMNDSMTKLFFAVLSDARDDMIRKMAGHQVTPGNMEQIRAHNTRVVGADTLESVVGLPTELTKRCMDRAK